VFFVCFLERLNFVFHHVLMHALPGKAIPEMTYTVSDGMLNPTHSLLHSLLREQCLVLMLHDWFLMAKMGFVTFSLLV